MIISPRKQEVAMNKTTHKINDGIKSDILYLGGLVNIPSSFQNYRNKTLIALNKKNFAKGLFFDLADRGFDFIE